MATDQFQWRQGIMASDLNSTTRLVLLVLAHHANESGICWPSTLTIAAETGLSERAVCTHLDIAKRAGWVSAKTKGHSGLGWRRSEYSATFPEDAEPHSVPRAEGRSAPNDRVLNVLPEGTERDDDRALNDVQSNLTTNFQEKKRPSAAAPRFSDEDKSLASAMFVDLLALNPGHKKPNLEKWAQSIRLMREHDHRRAQDIAALWVWANAHTFWKTNILSPDKLREKWDRLVIQKNQQNGAGGQSNDVGNRFAGAL